MNYIIFLSALILSSCAIKQTPSSALTSPQKALKVKPAVPDYNSRIIEDPPHKKMLTSPDAIVTKPTFLPSQIKNENSQQDHPLHYQEVTSNGITFNIVSFDSTQYHLAVADQKPGEQWLSAKQASVTLNGVAAINGGFFNTDGKPLGAVRSAGKSSGVWNTASSLTSGVYQHDGRPSLKRNSRTNKSSPELLQTGPFLVENGSVVSGLSDRRSAQRSLILWDGKNHWGIATTSACTLADLANAVKELPSGYPKKTALNLDGGRSCDLFVSTSVKNGGTQKSHWLKSAVRNYLVIVKN